MGIRINISRLFCLGILPFVLLAVLASCSSTANIPDGDQLFVGLTKIAYERNDTNANPIIAKKNFITTQEEVEAAIIGRHFPMDFGCGIPSQTRKALSQNGLQNRLASNLY